MTDEQGHPKVMEALYLLQDAPILADRFSKTDPEIEDEAVPGDSHPCELRQPLLRPSDQELHGVTIGRDGFSLHDRDRQAVHEYEWHIGVLGKFQHSGVAEPGHVVQDIHPDLPEPTSLWKDSGSRG